MLSKEAFRRSVDFVKAKGRPLEVARLRFHFEGVPASDVADELVKYQNEDGGFGNALEPDLRTPESSALATSVAFQLFRETGLRPEERIVSLAVDYLIRTFEEGRQRWRIIPEEAGKSPHAPWWGQSTLEEVFNGCALNPTAELLGYLYEYGTGVPQPLLASLSEKVLSRLGALDKITMHDFLACKSLAETDALDEAFKARIHDELNRFLYAVVSVEPSEWAEYDLHPIQVADGPHSPWFRALRNVVPDNLDYEIANQQEDGSWPVAWSWGGAHPDVWEQAQAEWCGVLTVEKLLTLKRYGRIEGVAEER